MMDAQPTSNLRYEVEFPCGHTVAHEENCPRCENDRLRAALRLILPLAKGYSPPGQSESARRTCNEWIAAAEAQLSGDSSAPTSIPSNLRTFLGKVADLGCSTVDSSGKCIACEAADFLRGPLPDETASNPQIDAVGVDELLVFLDPGICECRECPECGRMPSECTGTECANTCQCSECGHCRIQFARAELKKLPSAVETEPNPVVCNNHDRSGTAYGYQPDPTDVVTRGAVVYGSLTARDPNDLTRELWTMTKYWRLAPSAEKASGQPTTEVEIFDGESHIHRLPAKPCTSCFGDKQIAMSDGSKRRCEYCGGTGIEPAVNGKGDVCA